MGRAIQGQLKLGQSRDYLMRLGNRIRGESEWLFSFWTQDKKLPQSPELFNSSFQPFWSYSLFCGFYVIFPVVSLSLPDEQL